MGHDPALVRALMVVPEDRGTVAGLPAADHVAVQEATLAALLDGAYDGELTIAELLTHGGHGVGTLNGLDGELVIVDGEAWRAGADGSVTRVPGEARTPFAVVTRLRDATAFAIEQPVTHDELLALIEAHLPADARAAVVRVDGTFDRVHARSVARQHPPYRPLTEVAAEQVEWTWHGLEATVVGFRFDDRAAGVEVVGHHLHVLSADRAHAGHVLACDLRHGTARVEYVDELHLALPPGVGVPDPDAFGGGAAVRRIEGE